MSEFIEFSIDDEQVIRALRSAPKIMGKHLARALDRAALEVAREERRQEPKAFSLLVNSTYPERVSPLARIVGPHVNYARYVEEGTDGGGKPPPAQTLMEWIRVKRIQPRTPGMSDESLAEVIAKSIAVKGTPANPFRKRTVEKTQSRVFDLIRASTVLGLREAGFKD